MVCRERQQHAVNQNNVLEIIYHALAVQEIHGRAQEIPVQRLGEPEAARARGHVGDGDDFFEADYLDGRHDDDDVDVAGEHATEKDGNHYEGPDGAGDEGLFFLVVVGDGLGLLFLRCGQPSLSSLCDRIACRLLLHVW